MLKKESELQYAKNQICKDEGLLLLQSESKCCSYFRQCSLVRVVNMENQPQNKYPITENAGK
jgi:hypothetical protein